MGYYRGDHYRSMYRGDYYRGDPGFFSFIGNALKGVAKVAGGAILGTITGGPVGGIIGALKGTASAVTSGTREATLAAGGDESAYTPELQAKHAAALSNPPALRGPGSALVAPTMGQLPMLPGQPGAGRAMHFNKSTYVTRGGGTSHWPQQLTIHTKHSELVKSRRMNVGNARALRRALRRARGFVKLARRAGVAMHSFKRSNGKRKK